MEKNEEKVIEKFDVSFEIGLKEHYKLHFSAITESVTLYGDCGQCKLEVRGVVMGDFRNFEVTVYLNNRLFMFAHSVRKIEYFAGDWANGKEVL